MTPKPGSTGPRARPDDVRAALLQAAANLIESGPESAVSLRACARTAGVSHAAPAHYFPTRADLIGAVLAEGFDDLAARMIAARDAAPDDPFARLKAIGMAYIAFALSRPATYDMMFQRCNRDGEQGRVMTAADHCGGVLWRAVAETRRPEGVDDRTGVNFAWMAVHGYVSLVINGLIDGGPGPDAIEVMADRLLSLLEPAFTVG